MIAHSIQKHWNRRSIQRFLDFSHDKEHDDAQFLQIEVSIAKLPPLLYHCKVFIKYVFVLSCIALIYAADCSMRHYAGFSHVGSHICVLWFQHNWLVCFHFKPGAYQPAASAPGFLKVLVPMSIRAHVYVCVHPEAVSVMALLFTG